eukprot:CCRYP_001595-RA/>CCRYP_001595-RA protein AED:0.32 eAED:0.10 QI:0/-1/0/1/-1/1/1/0/242
MMDVINRLLFTDLGACFELCSDPEKIKNPILEGMALLFVKLIPSFCDRRAYYFAILPAGSMVECNQFIHSAPLPVKAKRFFDKQLKDLSFQSLKELFSSVLDGFSMLHFPIDTKKGMNDGTDDLMVVYKWLAIRDATWTKPNRCEEYLSMDGTDMIRNLLLGSFSLEAEGRVFYDEYWLTLERRLDKIKSKIFSELLIKRDEEGESRIWGHRRCNVRRFSGMAREGVIGIDRWCGGMPEENG